MSHEVKVFEFDPEVKTAVTKFRTREEKTSGALIIRFDPSKQLLVVEKLHDDISAEDLKKELPQHLPVYILYSYFYKHDDGRTSHPLFFIFISPTGSKPELQLMYSGNKRRVAEELRVKMVFELRSYEGFTEEWLLSKLHDL
ncbi:glia maturation factor gamma-like [Exaiptasia diaphana]|uniref:ADF-H domain-containing protein n=1 Tax=Exaiptasia diaphana TaxID=2652724 RepID=A0A913X027_EXADI|nr:glia maturation factor gamma-like [Exaiptasia diaphana]